MCPSFCKQVPRLPREAGDKKANYTTSWTLRSTLLVMMHMRGISGLKPGSMSVWKFARMNPDQTGALSKLFRTAERSKKPLDTIQRVMDAVQRKRRPELVSMDLCFASDRSLDNIDFDNKPPLAEFHKAKAALRQRDGMTPHIAHIVRKVLTSSQASRCSRTSRSSGK